MWPNPRLLGFGIAVIFFVGVLLLPGDSRNPAFVQEVESAQRQMHAIKQANDTPHNMEFIYRLNDRQSRSQ